MNIKAKDLQIVVAENYPLKLNITFLSDDVIVIPYIPGMQHSSQ